MAMGDTSIERSRSEIVYTIPIEMVVPSQKARERLDTFLTRELPHVTRNKIQQLIRKGAITVNGQKVKPNHLVKPHEKIHIEFPKPTPVELIPENIPLDIIYEDEYLLVVNKAPGMVVHPACGHPSGTLVNALLGHAKTLSPSSDPYRPGIVHRLDKDTSGLLVVAKNEKVHQALSKQFEQKIAHREYIALVWGKFEKPSGTIETYLARSKRDRKKIAVSNEGKLAITHYRVKETFDFLTLLELTLGTGRTHQIRVHMAYLGHPVFGDAEYGGRTRGLTGLNRTQTAQAIALLELMPRQALHAKILEFIHPVTQARMRLDSPIPQDFQAVLDRLRNPLEFST